MKFCKYCGKQLEDNETCTCQSQGAESDNAPEQKQAPASPYGEIVSKPESAQSPTADKIKKACKDLPLVFKSYFKSPNGTVEIAKREKDVITATIMSIIFFVTTFLYNLFLMLAVKNLGDSIGLGYFGVGFEFNFGKVLLTAIVMTVLIVAMMDLVQFLLTLIITKAQDKKAKMIDSYITASFSTIFASILMIITGIFFFISIKIAAILLLIMIVYFVVICVENTISSCQSISKTTVSLCLSTIFIVIAFAICIYASIKLLSWNLDFDGIMDVISGVRNLF